MEQKTKLLLAEDDENLGLLLKEYLVAKGYDASLFPDGEAAYKGFMRDHYDICILDIMMPKKDGFEVMEELAADQELKKIPVIIVSNSGQPVEIERAVTAIEAELADRLKELGAAGKLLEAQRIEQRTRYDLEMIRQAGYCHGIENYSRHLSGRPPGERPLCLLDYLFHDSSGGLEGRGVRRSF